MADSKTVKRRLMREYQRKCRGGKRSYRTETEDLKLMLAWQAGELSEGQISRIWNCGRVEARERIDTARLEGADLGEALWLECRKPLRRLETRRDRLKQQASEIDDQIRERGV